MQNKEGKNQYNKKTASGGRCRSNLSNSKKDLYQRKQHFFECWTSKYRKSLGCFLIDSPQTICPRYECPQTSILQYVFETWINFTLALNLQEVCKHISLKHFAKRVANRLLPFVRLYWIPSQSVAREQSWAIEAMK
jgi:hypothetical protein